jgi:hypothetical protein
LAPFFAGTGAAGPVTQIWRNTHSSFTDIQAGLPILGYGNPSWGDYDHDGRLDFFIHNGVWRNTGDHFTNINAGLTPLNGRGEWGDYDKDSRLDLWGVGT